MYIDVVFSPGELISRGDISDKSVIVIDALRATTTIAYALWGYRRNDIDEILGCSKIIPVETLDGAKELAKKFSKDEVVLTGERGCLKPEGFDLGNSPSDYTPENVQEKTLILTTTNGTKALKMAEAGGAKYISTGSFVNATACVDKIFELRKDVIILCAGRSGKTAKEDTACAGLLAGLLETRCNEINEQVELYDSTDIAIKYFNDVKYDILSMLQSSEAGRHLIQVGLEKDLIDCSVIDAISIPTEFKNGYITVTKV